MAKFLILLAVLFAAALGFHWLKDTSGEVVLTLGDTAYAVDLVTAVIGLLVVFIAAMLLIWLVRALLRAPGRMARGWRRRNAERGRLAVSQGLIAVAAGDIRAAERAALEASRRARDLPLTRLLEAQTAQLKGDRDRARTIFQEMTETGATRIAGLRGLYIEAEREGQAEAARQIAETARREAPSAPWAARALLRHQAAAGDWDGALRTLSGAVDGRILDKRTARRQRAVVLTAKALASEVGEPDVARAAALEAHELAPDLVPAAVVASRLLARHGDVRRATRVLEGTWKAGPHPEVADAYLHVRSGDSAGDRLKRAETLLRLRAQSDEGRLAVARAAIDARNFERAREALTPVLTSRPTQRALILMAELAEAETGDTGRAREWMARAVNAPRDPVWTADGVILDAWAPASPVTGRLDTVEWKVPVAELEPPRMAIQAEELKPPPAIEVLEHGELVEESPQAVEPLQSAAPEPPAETPRASSGDVPISLAASLEQAVAEAVAEPPKASRDSPPSRAARRRTVTIPPPHGAVPKGARETTRADPSQPRPPDDPGVSDEEPEEAASRRFRVV
jgi:HemY protein